MIRKWLTLSKNFIDSSVIFKHYVYERQSQDTGAKGDFDIIMCADWVNIVAFDKDDRMVFVRQYRHGNDDITLEIPGGAVDRGEDPFVAAKRELQEETGYTSENWKYLGEVHPNPAFMTNSCRMYLATDCEKTHELNLDPLEEIEVNTFTRDEVEQMVKKGEITHSLVIAAFYFENINKN